MFIVEVDTHSDEDQQDEREGPELEPGHAEVARVELVSEASIQGPEVVNARYDTSEEDNRAQVDEGYRGASRAGIDQKAEDKKNVRDAETIAERLSALELSLFASQELILALFCISALEQQWILIRVGILRCSNDRCSLLIVVVHL